MALTATVHRLQIGLSDVDRSVYEALDLRVARHPSESARYLWTRVLAYALSYEEGIAFSKAGIASTDDPPISICDATGALRAWIDVGSPSAERLHRATKAAPRVALFTHADLALLRREAASRHVHRLAEVDVFWLPPTLLDALEPALDRHVELEVVRSDGHLYITVGGQQLSTPLERDTLAPIA